ncbi:MAG: Alpha-keto acid-binding periplasmic protein TakP precursor [Syntrophaceae bacterium PtaU1.Bin231]|nr:MAG: Alpha-keto acid-binding periplasmic protein TakP precursor [Syntrophaceae bacterium PtaU1.Bin231]
MRILVGLLVAAAFMMGGVTADLAQAAAPAQFKWKLQSAHPAGAPQIELLNRMVADIDKMSGGRLKIEVLASGAIVNPFEILDGVNKGIIECGQWWTHYSMGKNPSGSLFSSPLGGAGSGLDMMNHLSWYLNGGGRELYLEYYQKILKADVMPFLIAPDGPEAFGWAKKAPKTLQDYLKMRYRMSSGLSSDVLKDMGGIPVNVAGQELIPALERGVIDGGEWINTASDLKLGLYDVAKNYCLQGLHQAIGIQDIMINGKAWRALPADIQAIVAAAAEKSILDGILFFVEENAKALQILTKEKGVKLFDAPAGYSDAFIKSSKKVLAKFEEKDPFFKRVLDSQRKYAQLVVPFTKETNKLGQLIAGAAETAK